MTDKTGIISAKKLHKCNGRSSWILKFPLYKCTKVPKRTVKQIEKAKIFSFLIIKVADNIILKTKKIN